MTTNNETDLINWVEEAIVKNHIRKYEYKQFSDIQGIGKGFGKVFRAKWENPGKYFALKSFFDINKDTIKEIVNEVNKRPIYCFVVITTILIRFNNS